MTSSESVEPYSQERYPDAWERLPEEVADQGVGQCLFENNSLNELLTEATASNLSIQRLKSQLEEARLGVVIARADRLPTLSTSLTSTRRKSGLPGATNVDTTFSLSADAQFEVDIWRRLSTTQRQAQLLYRAAQFEYEDTMRLVHASVARAWLTAIFARELAEVFEGRVESVGNNLDIVEQAYKQGINSALDVYLARTSFSQEQSRLARQRQIAKESVGALQVLLNNYPDGRLLLDRSLPGLSAGLKKSRPQAVLERRPDIQRAWTQLLAQDAAVAVAHKQRFPRLTLSASLDDLGSEISDIVDGDDLLWSVIAGISQPVFQAGRLKMLELQARERLIQSEYAYTAVIQNAFLEVEDSLGNTSALISQIAASERAVEAASAAYDLSFSQYQRGLVNYTTVLQSEQRSFDATSSLLELRYQQLINRVDLCTALGGGTSN